MKLNPYPALSLGKGEGLHGQKSTRAATVRERPAREILVFGRSLTVAALMLQFFFFFARAAEIALHPGHHEITFKNGKTAQGEILAVEGEKFRFQPYEGSAFVLPLDRIQTARALSPAEGVLFQSRQMAEKGKLDEAVRLLTRSAGMEGGAALEGELMRRLNELNRLIKASQKKELAEFEKKFEELLDRNQLHDALDLARQTLKDHPDDPDLLGDAALAEFRIHRGQGGIASEFRSFHLDRLKKADPQSPILLGIQAEMGVSEKLQAKWESDRKAFLATALDDAARFYENFQLQEAKDILDKALALDPPDDLLGPLKELAAKVDAEIAGGSKDQALRERERLRALEEKTKMEGESSGKSLSESESKKLDKKRARRIQQRAIDQSRGPR